ncbi:MAG: hypothetical protein K2O39_00195 [Clostridiales bacterium]|nr:hypothetical protein [Clostridiales bacterium]
MARINVGCEYEKEFKSICSLYKNGFLSDKVNIKRVTDTEIVTAANVFVYCEDEHGVNGAKGNEENELRFDKDGASWFANLRGKKFDSSSSDWEQLIADVGADYHKYYSLIEFRQSIDSRLTAVGGAVESVIKKFADGFLKRVIDAPFAVSERYTPEAENYYAVSMRLEINGGAESEPLLGKVYFRVGRDGKFIPISRGEAKGIDDYIKAAVPSDDGQGDGGELVDGQLVSAVLNRTGSLFEDEGCADYIMFNPYYLPKIEKMLKLLATSDEKELECTHVTVLGISHVEWQNFSYAVSVGGKNVLKLVVGLNNSVSLYCTNCSKDGVLLVENNNVLFDQDEYDGGYELDFSDRNLGLNANAISLIKSSALLSRHLFKISCKENMRNSDCSRLICSSQAVEYEDADGNIFRKCKGCPYPEVVYHNIFASGVDDGKLTSALNLDEQAFVLTDGKVKKCKCCGRTYGEHTGKNGYCRLCGDTEVTDEGKKLYRKYGKMLGLRIRFKHIKDKKRCKEDSNIIIFELGNERFVFNKLDASDYGYIKPPKKVK